MAVESLIMGWEEGKIHETEQREINSGCVVQGKTQESVENTIKEYMTLNPNLDENDLREKLSYNVGLYITHVDVKDMVETIQFPKG